MDTPSTCHPRIKCPPCPRWLLWDQEQRVGSRGSISQYLVPFIYKQLVLKVPSGQFSHETELIRIKIWTVNHILTNPAILQLSSNPCSLYSLKRSLDNHWLNKFLFFWAITWIDQIRSCSVPPRICPCHLHPGLWLRAHYLRHYYMLGPGHLLWPDLPDCQSYHFWF